MPEACPQDDPKSKDALETVDHVSDSVPAAPNPTFRCMDCDDPKSKVACGIMDVAKPDAYLKDDPTNMAACEDEDVIRFINGVKEIQSNLDSLLELYGIAGRLLFNSPVLRTTPSSFRARQASTCEAPSKCREY